MKTFIVALALLTASDGAHKALAGERDPLESFDISGDQPPAGARWLESIDLSRTSTGFGLPTTAATVSGNPISIGGKPFVHGVGMHADASITLPLANRATRFVADVGIDDDLKCFEAKGATTSPRVEFTVWVDGKKAASSGFVGFGTKPVRLDVSLRGVRTLRLSVVKAPGSHFNHATWAGAALFMVPGAALPAATASAPMRNMQVSAVLSQGDEAKLRAVAIDANTIWLDTLDLKSGRVNAGNLWLGGIVSRAPGDAKPLSAGKTADGNPLRMAAVNYPHGVASEGENELRIQLDGFAKRFVARVGFNTSFSCSKVNASGDALFEVWVDGRPAVQTPHVHGYDRPYDISVDLTGAKTLVLHATSDGGPVAWAGAFIEVASGGLDRVRTVPAPAPVNAVIAKRNPHELRINGPRVVGATPGRPFVFKIPATGQPPLSFSARHLPVGLSLDSKTGVVTGAVKKPGTTSVAIEIAATNGSATSTLEIVAGRDKLALTPPMGWNSWNVWALKVDDGKVRAAADAMVSSGLAAQGYQYINIDEGWADGRDAAGNIKPSARFPDMHALAAYVHAKGLRLGIYSSPGPKSCGGGEGSYQHEQQDARTWASWDIDYLKYDWCSYGSVAKDNSLNELQKPYKIMQTALRDTDRDVVFSLCQYGLGDVWKWGRDVGGNLWRTGADIVDTWASLSDLGFTQAGREAKIGPGGWNDPDMMIVGKLGWGKEVHPTRLTQDEQVSHVTLWSMLASPLLLGNDLSQLDDFTSDVLQNPEVIDINQDALGRQAVRKTRTAGVEIWTRPLHDGSTAIALFNRAPVAVEAVATWKDLGMRKKQSLRDVWLRKDLGVFDGHVSVSMPSHGAVLLRAAAR